MDIIAITFDIDWAPDELVKYVIDLLEQYQIKATFFATHRSTLLKSLDSENYEVGIHPNFNNCGDHNKVIKDLKVIYPEAIGVRSHSLFESSNILRLFLGNGLKYDTNTFIPLREGLYPFIRLDKLVRIPYYWEDDAHFSCSKKTFKLSELKLPKRGLKIYNFHPMHIFMNTDSLEHYNRYKLFYHQPDLLMNFRNTGGGTQTLFLGLLQYITKHTIPTYTCKEIYQEYLTKEKLYEFS